MFDTVLPSKIVPFSQCAVDWHLDTSSKRMTIYLTSERHHVDNHRTVVEIRINLAPFLASQLNQLSDYQARPLPIIIFVSSLQ